MDTLAPERCATRPAARQRRRPVAEIVGGEVSCDPAYCAHGPASNGGDRKDLPLETRIQFSHLHADALKFRTRGARREVCVACGYVGEGALPSDIRLSAITPRMFDEYFTGWKPDRKAHCGSLASHIEDFGGQTRLGVV